MLEDDSLPGRAEAGNKARVMARYSRPRMRIVDVIDDEEFEYLERYRNNGYKKANAKSSYR
jgi:predicted transcriptional regulator